VTVRATALGDPAIITPLPRRSTRSVPPPEAAAPKAKAASAAAFVIDEGGHAAASGRRGRHTVVCPSPIDGVRVTNGVRRGPLCRCPVWPSSPAHGQLRPSPAALHPCLRGHIHAETPRHPKDEHPSSSITGTSDVGAGLGRKQARDRAREALPSSRPRSRPGGKQDPRRSTQVTHEPQPPTSSIRAPDRVTTSDRTRCRHRADPLSPL
jgi:hypothetical protein